MTTYKQVLVRLSARVGAPELLAQHSSCVDPTGSCKLEPSASCIASSQLVTQLEKLSLLEGQPVDDSSGHHRRQMFKNRFCFFSFEHQF
eukprot:jgi/Phyca11/117965/e_gw1.34.379.1